MKCTVEGQVLKLRNAISKTKKEMIYLKVLIGDEVIDLASMAEVTKNLVVYENYLFEVDVKVYKNSLSAFVNKVKVDVSQYA